MSKPIGIGTRVYVGWTANVDPEERGDLCQIAEVSAGPFPHGADLPKHPEPNICGQNVWEVFFGNGENGYAAESLLFPIDDDDDERQVEERCDQEVKA